MIHLYNFCFAFQYIFYNQMYSKKGFDISIFCIYYCFKDDAFRPGLPNYGRSEKTVAYQLAIASVSFHSALDCTWLFCVQVFASTITAVRSAQKKHICWQDAVWETLVLPMGLAAGERKGRKLSALTLTTLVVVSSRENHVPSCDSAPLLRP